MRDALFVSGFQRVTYLPCETFAKLLGRNFDRHVAIQAWIVRLPHLSHAAFTDRRTEFVRAKLFAGRERHVRDSV
jgi:hypothetical protein